MKILLISTRFYPHIGGVEEVVANISRNLSREHELVVVSSLDSAEALSGFSEKISKVSTAETEVNGVRNKRIWINLPSSLLGYMIFPYRFVKSVIEFVTYVKKFNPDVINYHFPDDSSIYLYLLAIRSNIPIIVNIHGNDLHIYSKKLFHRFFIKRILKGAASVVVNSSYMKSELLEVFPEIIDKVRIISNGLDIELYKNILAKPYFSDPYIFYVGRIVHKKGVDLLVRAFYKLNNLNLKMLIEGKGEELEEIKKITKELGLASKITFTEGKLSTEQKISAMKGSLFGVIPSRIEPFGIVALEFMAAGTPFIASKTGGLNDLLIDGETCLFFESENLNDLANKLEKLASDGHLRNRLAENGQKESEKYRWDVISEKYYNLFKEIL